MTTLCSKGLIKAYEALQDTGDRNGSPALKNLDEQSMALAIEAYLRYREDRCPGLLLDLCESYRSFKATWLSVSEEKWSFNIVIAMIFLGASAVLMTLMALAFRSISSILG